MTKPLVLVVYKSTGIHKPKNMYLKSLLLVGLTLLLFSCTPTYMVVFTAGEGGSVSTPGGEFDEGTVVSVTAQPNPEYEFEQWSDGSTRNPLTIGVVEPISLTAYFKKKQYEFTVNVQGEGTVKEDVLIQGSKLNSGSQVKLTALPASGWYFDSWTGSVSGNVNPLSVDINGSKTITAVFKRKKYDLTVTIEGEGTVTEQVVVQPGQYDYQTQVKLTAVPKEGWEFTSWGGDIGSTTNPINVTVDSDKDISVVFSRKKFNLIVTVNGDGTVTEEIVVQPGQYDYETQVKLTAFPPEEGWEFTSWSGDITSTENPIVISVDGTKNITVNFSKLNPLYLGENGVTIKSKSFAHVGDEWEINGKQYVIVDRDYLLNNRNKWNNYERSVTSKVTDMSGLFGGRTKEIEEFNGDISHWDTSNVITMERMFTGTRSFNQDISLWDVSKVINMSEMFFTSKSFNQDIGSWDVSNVINMKRMFQNTLSFNQDIGSWDVSKVLDMTFMFSYSNFNQNIGDWDVSKVTYMIGMFSYNEKFNQNIGDWDVSNLSNMNSMFWGAVLFNQNLNSWDVSNVSDMRGVFYRAQNFNGDISNWDVSKVTTMRFMFQESNLFNQDLSNWNVSNVSDMSRMFMGAVSFNQDISSWDVSKVSSMKSMFDGYYSTNLNAPKPKFNQNLNSWNVQNVIECEFFLRSTPNWILPKPNFTQCKVGQL